MPQVSVIVLTYNPDPQKLRKTLEAAVSQRDVSLEIIISDDGSANKDFSFLPDFFAKWNFTNYKLIENPQNRGTVHNCYAGVCAASGEYVFLTSPGDILFDDTTMSRFFRFAAERQAQLCFGNAVRYALVDGQVQRTNLYSIPAAPDVYGPGSSQKRQKRGFFGDNFIIGACYFRSRKFAKQYFGELLDVSKYMEDTPSTMFALADGIPIHYYDSNIVFYEDGTGVSTGVSEKWQKLLRQDLIRSLEKLHAQKPGDPYVKIALKNASEPSRFKRMGYRFIAHPFISMGMLLERKLRKTKPVPCSEADLERLQKLLTV